MVDPGFLRMGCQLQSWGCQPIITARIRSMTGRYCLHRCLSVNISGGGTPSQVWIGGYPISGLGRGGTPSQVQVGGYPISGLGGYPISGPGGTPSQVHRGYPISGLGGYPISGPGRGVPHLRSRGIPIVPPPGIASTCYGYAAGGMPLAFTQEDFLVVTIFSEKSFTK